jgi:hypothetical protein
MRLELAYRASTALVATLLVAAVSSAACGSREEDEAAPAASLAVTLNRATAKLGSPVDVTYSFTPMDHRQLEKNYWVLVHFVAADGRIVWIDDHRPPTPTSEWQVARAVEYTRTAFIPESLPVGNVSLQVGLFLPDSQERLRLAGQEVDHRTYAGGTFRLEPADVIEFRDGWHDREGAPGDPIHWRWTKRQATLAFRNPKADAILYLNVETAELFPEAVRVKVSLGGVTVDEFDVAPKRVLRRTRVDAKQFGNEEMVNVTIHVDKTFVPAALTPGTNKDRRELGIRVFNATIEPVLSTR